VLGWFSVDTPYCRRYVHRGEIVSKKLVSRVVSGLLVLSFFGVRQYSDYKETQQIKELKSNFQTYLLGDSSKAKLQSFVVDGTTLALVINIKSQQIDDKIKAKLVTNSHRILPTKVCDAVGLRNWLQNGNRVSIDIRANGDIYSLTNISIIEADCT